MVFVTGDTAATPLVTGLGGPDELALFGGPPFGALAISSTGTVQRIADLAVSPLAATTVTLPAGSVIEGAALSLGNGDAASGDGFGFLVGAVSGTPTIFSAVPDPANPGVTWVASTAAPTGLPAAPTRVTCLGAETCVAITGTADTSGNNAFIYRNAAAPVTALLTPEPTIDEGGSATVSVDASDADGDALYLRWTPDAADVPVTFTLSPDQKTATFTAQAGTGKVCGATPVPFGFTFSAGDGLAGHVGTSAVRVNVRHTSLPESPVRRSQRGDNLLPARRGDGGGESGRLGVHARRVRVAPHLGTRARARALARTARPRASPPSSPRATRRARARRTPSSRATARAPRGSALR